MKSMNLSVLPLVMDKNREDFCFGKATKSGEGKLDSKQP